jgi:hypothetical protein
MISTLNKTILHVSYKHGEMDSEIKPLRYCVPDLSNFGMNRRSVPTISLVASVGACPRIVATVERVTPCTVRKAKHEAQDDQRNEHQPA